MDQARRQRSEFLFGRRDVDFRAQRRIQRRKHGQLPQARSTGRQRQQGNDDGDQPPSRKRSSVSHQSGASRK
ncbi:MAG: hypothetical protein HZC24_15125 [Rhodocyclales bacterium]|nr:hypothetical protein [Rhodocyclales bacterium]